MDGAAETNLSNSTGVLPSIDQTGQPASLSSAIIGGLIRKRLGFKGIGMTDSLAMGALHGISAPEAAERALAAGADILLIASDQNISGGLVDAAVNQAIAAVRAGRIPESRLDTAVARVLALKRAYPLLCDKTAWAVNDLHTPQPCTGGRRNQ